MSRNEEGKIFICESKDQELMQKTATFFNPMQESNTQNPFISSPLLKQRDKQINNNNNNNNNNNYNNNINNSNNKQNDAQELVKKSSSPQESLKRPGVTYKLPQASQTILNKVQETAQDSNQSTNRAQLQSSMKRVRVSNSFQNLQKFSDVNIAPLNGQNPQKSIKQISMENMRDKDKEKEYKYQKIQTQDFNDMPLSSSPVMNQQKVKSQDVSNITNGSIQESQFRKMSNQINVSNNESNFMLNHQKLIQQVQLNQKQQHINFQYQKSIYDSKQKEILEKIQQKKQPNNSKQFLDVSVMNINAPEAHSSLRQSQVVQPTSTPLNSTPPQNKQLNIQRQPNIITNTSTPVTSSSTKQNSINTNPSQINVQLQQQMRKTKLSQAFSQQLFVAQDKFDFQASTFRKDSNNKIQYQSIQRPLEQSSADSSILKLPQIGGNADFKSTIENGMRKSKTAQEQLREQWQQQADQQIIKQETQQNQVLPQINGGTAQGFSQSKQGKPFLKRRPQAKIVSRIFSSKSDNN